MGISCEGMLLWVRGRSEKKFRTPNSEEVVFLPERFVLDAAHNVKFMPCNRMINA